MGFGFNHRNTITKNNLSIATMVFIDDAQLFQSNTSITTREELCNSTQALVDVWGEALLITGGLLVPQKSSCTWIEKKCNVYRRWSYNKSNSFCQKIHISNTEGNPITISYLDPSEIERELGVKLQKNDKKISMNNFLEKSA